jgi:hypothetical protein
MGGTADHRRLSVDDALAQIPAIRRTAMEPRGSIPIAVTRWRAVNNVS